MTEATDAATNTEPSKIAPADQISSVNPHEKDYMSFQSDMGCNKLTVEVGGKSPRTHTTDQNPGPNPRAVHEWEKCGLGVAPYKLIGSGSMTYQACHDAPIQPGSSCDYCGQGLYNVFFIRAACGSTFHVGCDCVRRACAPREGVLTEVERAFKAHQAKLRAANTKKKTAKTIDDLEALISENEAALRALPHPRADRGEFFAAQSFMSYVEWMLEHAGHAGRSKVLKQIKAALKGGG